MAISSISFQEQISSALGFEEDIFEDTEEPQEPERMNTNVILDVINTQIFLDDKQRQHMGSIVMILAGDPLLKVTPASRGEYFT